MPAQVHSIGIIENIRRLKVEDRLSASQIAAQYGVTRNVIIGICYRNAIGVERITTGRKPRPSGWDRTNKQRPARVRDSRLPPPFVARPGPDGGIGLIALDAQNCHYPISGEKESTRFCGAAVERGHTYCPHHHRLCYKPPGAPPDESPLRASRFRSGR